MNLIQYLQTVRGYCTQPDYPFWVVLVLVVMGTMRGCMEYRALANFVIAVKVISKPCLI
ncbi:MAG: hypothetical protein HC781_05230 [Leptolyngbyaceae cyanobacterium CSU_1_4]|nr:hypothetical protein [Leptolyngbyaceae cyanobacterium CSU_1_4]